MAETVKRTQDELLAELVARFGGDPMNWAFECPSCGDIATGRDFRDRLTELTDQNPEAYRDRYASDFLGQICYGRLAGALTEKPYSGRGCDWAAGGLFRGPDFVITPDGREIPSFRIAPAPTTPED